MQGADLDVLAVVAAVAADEILGYSWDDKAVERGEDAPIKAGAHSVDAARCAIKTPEVLWRPMLRRNSTSVA